MGNEGKLAIELDFDSKIYLINTYLPTNKHASEYAYSECLDVLHDILSRYGQSHQIVLCDDLNGTLLPTRNNKHVNEHLLSTSGHSSVKPTFYHFNGTDTYQTDYILTNEVDLFETYCSK